MERLQRIRVEISEDEHAQLIKRLRNTPTDLDPRRTDIGEWRKGRIYFHALQDLTLAAEPVLSDKDLEDMTLCQACFVKDFDMYFSGFPEDETEMLEVFQAIFSVGTSFEWQTDHERVRSLRRIFADLDKQRIRPWVVE